MKRRWENLQITRWQITMQHFIMETSASHAGTSALDTFIIVERHRTTPPPLSANPFLTIFTEKHTGFKYLGIMHIPLFLSFVLDNSQRHGVIFTGFFYMHSAVECQPHITAGFLLRSVSHVITS